MRDARFDRKEKESAGISMQVVGDTMLPLGVLGSCAAAIAMGMSMPPLLPILFGVLGCYLSWALSRVLRGLGEMVEDAAATRNINEEILAVLREQRGCTPETSREDVPQGFSFPQWEEGMITSMSERRTPMYTESDDSAKHPAE